MGLLTDGSARLNYIAVSGVVLGHSELRTVDSGRVLLVFNLWVDGGREGTGPTVQIVHFLKSEQDAREILESRVIVYGSLRRRFDRGGLFIAAREIVIATASADRIPLAEVEDEGGDAKRRNNDTNRKVV